MPKPKKPRKPTAAQLAQTAALASKYAAAQFAPEWQEIAENYSIPEIVEAVQAMKKKSKRTKGRPAIPNKNAILDAAALAKVRDGRYTQIARSFHLTPQQLIDLVQHNRKSFTERVHRLRKNARIKA